MTTGQLNWKSILIIGLTAVLCLGFYYGYKIYKIFKSALEGFQANMAGTGSCPYTPDANLTPWEPGQESSDEIMTYDAFEVANTPNVGETMPTNMEKYDSAAALAEFDDNAPVPWDFDNKDDDPVDVLWGYVDTRCSMFLWDRARMRAIFGTANNFEVGDDGKVSYYSAYLNGMVFHDESQINAVKYLEFFIDFFAEEVIEGALGSIIPRSVDEKLTAKANAAVHARKMVNAGEKTMKTLDKGLDAAKVARANAIKAGKTATEADAIFREIFQNNVTAADIPLKQGQTLQNLTDDIFQEANSARSAATAAGKTAAEADDAFASAFRKSGIEKTGAITAGTRASAYNNFYQARKTELLAATKGAEETAERGTGYIARARGKIDDVLKGAKTAIKRTLRAIGKVVLAPAVLTGKQLMKLGSVRAAINIAKMAAKRLGTFMSKIAQKFFFISALVATLPFPFNLTLQAIDLVFTIVVLAVIPQVLSVMADLDEEPDSDNCNDQKQGCPITHPFNMRCAMIQATSPAFYEFFTAIPTVGDIIGSFAPYICMNSNLESVFRQSMRPPPYFFDTSLSLFYCEKPNVMDGDSGREDFMYYDPGVFKLYNNRTDHLTLTLPPTIKVPSGVTKNYFVPWVDFAHPEMLNKMADFYMKNSKRNQAVDMNGFVSFEFISNFKGLIASSQLSCDVQVELREVRMRPISNQPVDLSEMGCPIPPGQDFTFPIPSPWEIDASSPDPSQQRWKSTISPSSETGYTFHDRRFYFIVDYKQVARLPKFQYLDFRGLDSAAITDLVQQAFTRVSSVERMEAYRAMHVVCGCTHVNGCAADIIDITADGNYLGDAPISLGNNGQGYIPPVLDVSSLNNANELPQDDTCKATRSVVNHYGVKGFGPNRGNKNSNKASDGSDGPNIYLPEDYEFYGVSENKTTTQRENVTTIELLKAVTPTPTDGDVRMVTSDTESNNNRRYIYTTYVKTEGYPLAPKAGDSNTGWFPYCFNGSPEMTTITNDLGSVSTLPTSGVTNGSVCLLTTNNRQYIYATYKPIPSYPIGSTGSVGAPATGWFPYNPKPLWKASSETPQYDNWLRCTTKYWQVARVTKSMKEKFGEGLLGATMALGPLLFGFKGGMAVTTADVAGLNTLIACTYLDMVNQTGTFVINGFIKTSQEKFIIDKGPAIRFAPGWVPNNAYNLIPKTARVPRPPACMPAPSSTDDPSLVCPSRILNQSVCANRKGIRIMAKLYKTQNSNTRRVKRIFSILPAFDANSQQNACIYDIHSVNILPDGTDGTDIRPETIAIPYRIEPNSRTCEFVPTDSTGASKYYPRPAKTSILPIPPDMTAFNPPIDEQTFTTLQNRRDFGFVPISCTATTTIGRELNELANKTKAASGYDAAVQAVADAYNCSRPSIKQSLTDQFNRRFQKVEGDPSKGYNVQILNILESKTPLPVGGERGVPVCYYKASVAVQKNYYDTSPTTGTYIIKMNLQPNPAESCGYELISHDFPVNYYNAPIPNEDNAPFEMPAEVIGQQKLVRPEGRVCNDGAYSDCSGLPIIDYLVTQFNAKNTDRKIMRVTRASTPKLSIAGSPNICEYEVDMLRTIGPGQTITERDTIRMKLKDTTDTTIPNYQCLFDMDEDYSAARFSGKSINKNSPAQLLSSDYMWPTSFAKRVRDSIGGYIRTYITGKNIADVMQQSSKNVSDKMDALANAITTGGGIAGCRNKTCVSPEIVIGFINRYNYDNTPPYPEGQFGVQQRSIIEVRRTGLADPNTCHIEVVEKIQQFVNFLKEPKPNTSAADSLIRYELKFYEFTITNTTLDGSDSNKVCRFKVKAFPTDDIERRRIDVTTNPKGIPVGVGTNIILPVGFDKSYSQRVINGYNIQVLNAVRTAVKALTMSQPYLGDIITGVQIETITSYCNVRPNVIEYTGTIAESVMVPDMGPVDVSGTGAIITCRWPEETWDPTIATFIGTSGAPLGATWNDQTGTYEYPSGWNGVIPPPIVEIFIPDRVEIKDQEVWLYDRKYPNPPYMYLGADVDKISEITKIMYPNPGKNTSYIKSITATTPNRWLRYDDGTKSPNTFTGSGEPVIPLRMLIDS